MTRDMLMCRECGHFVAAVSRNGSPVPRVDECPDCCGVEFKDIHTDETVRGDGPDVCSQ